MSEDPLTTNNNNATTTTTPSSPTTVNNNVTNDPLSLISNHGTSTSSPSTTMTNTTAEGESSSGSSSTTTSNLESKSLTTNNTNDNNNNNNNNNDADKPPPSKLVIAAQNGDIGTISEAPLANVLEPDPDGTTLLHWAAINGHVLLVNHLLERGASVDAVGGNLEATPLHWAVRSGRLNVAILLLDHGARPDRVDSQGFDALHLAVHSGMPYQVSLLAPRIPVDVPDVYGRTPLHWAAYQGDPVATGILLHHGHRPDATDPEGLTALHWAASRGSIPVLRLLLKAGADQNKLNSRQLTPEGLAQELKAQFPYHQSLLSVNRDYRRDARPARRMALFFAPFILLLTIPYLCFNIAGDVFGIAWFITFPTALGLGVLSHPVCHRAILGPKSKFAGRHDDDMVRSPFLLGLLSASVFLVFYTYVTRFVPLSNLWDGFILSPLRLLFLVLLSTCALYLYKGTVSDPGYCPMSENRNEEARVTEMLARKGQLDGYHWCFICSARRPIRAKHCSACNRCVARHDHHCPWFFNCVGIGNHRYFIYFLASLVFGVAIFDRLTVEYFMEIIDQVNGQESCGLLCDATKQDRTLVLVAGWSTLQLAWTLLTLGGQLFQISKQLTTFELSNLGRYGYMSGLEDSTGRRPPQPESDGHGHGHHHHHHHKGKLGQVAGSLLRVMGLDLYTRGGGARGIQQSTERRTRGGNPFDRGFVRNCTDFWTDGRDFGVDYRQLYELDLTRDETRLA